MKPLQFEAAHAAEWEAFAEQIKQAALGKRVDGALLAARYRRVCEHLALAQSRSYPMYLIDRLELLAQEAHQLIYRRQDYGLRALGRLLRVGIPGAVRAERRIVWLALALFTVPLVVAFGLAWYGPDFALRLTNAQQLRSFEAMYSDGQSVLGRARDAGDDWQMFGHYIFNNIGIGFRSFGAGILAGVGSAVVAIYNGLIIGVVGGHLNRVGLGHNFWPFVATHSAFELTGIVLSVAAGLRLGLGWLVPGRRTRLEALRVSATAAVPLVYAAFLLLLVAAAVEAFWSSAGWIAPWVKYTVAVLCWTLVVVWLCLVGRGEEPEPRRLQHAAAGGRDGRRAHAR